MALKHVSVLDNRKATSSYSSNNFVDLQGALWVAVRRGGSFLMPSLSFTEASVNSITTNKMEVNGFLAASKDMNAQNVKPRASSGESVLPF